MSRSRRKRHYRRRRRDDIADRHWWSKLLGYHVSKGRGAEIRRWLERNRMELLRPKLHELHVDAAGREWGPSPFELINRRLSETFAVRYSAYPYVFNLIQPI